MSKTLWLNIVRGNEEILWINDGIVVIWCKCDKETGNSKGKWDEGKEWQGKKDVTKNEEKPWMEKRGEGGGWGNIMHEKCSKYESKQSSLDPMNYWCWPRRPEQIKYLVVEF